MGVFDPSSAQNSVMVWTLFDNDCSENHEKLWKIIKNEKKYKNIDIFDHDCSENHEQLWKITTNHKIIDMFEYDCSEYHEIMVVLMDLEAETLSESRSFYARPAQISFKSSSC